MMKAGNSFTGLLKTAMANKREILEPYELHYSDLISISSSSSSSSSAEIKRLESVTEAVMEALGPTGPGLLTITGTPNVTEHRKYLLSRARDLSLLPHHYRNRILKVFLVLLSFPFN